MAAPVQQQHRQQADALVAGCHILWGAAPGALRASWAALQGLGLSSSQLAAIVRKLPVVLAYDWQGEAKLRLLSWAEAELGLSRSDFLLHHTRYTRYSAATIAMRADYLRQRCPDVWNKYLSRGADSLLGLLVNTKRFLSRAECTPAALDAFNRAWLATPAGRQWGGKPRRSQRRTPKG